MRFLLLFLTLLLQFNVSGYNLNNPLNNCAEKTLTSENQYFNERSNIDFRYQGQYEDVETGLYYNRFRWYSPDEGMYISQDPIRLLSGEGNFYAYVKDVNSWVDIFGLSGSHLHHTIPREIYNPRSGKPTKWLPELLAKHPDIKGSRRNPNRWRIPAKEHIALHNKGYNKIWIQEIDKLESIIPDKNKWEVNDILSIRDKLAKEFEIDKYKPKTSCKK